METSVSCLIKSGRAWRRVGGGVCPGKCFTPPREAPGRSGLDAAAARRCLRLMHSSFLYLWPSKEGWCSPSAREEGNPMWRLSQVLGVRREGGSLPTRGCSDEVENEVKAKVSGLGGCSPTGTSRGVRWLREELLGFMQRFQQRSVPLKPALAGLGFLSPRSHRVLLASQLRSTQLWVPARHPPRASSPCAGPACQVASPSNVALLAVTASFLILPPNRSFLAKC